MKIDDFKKINSYTWEMPTSFKEGMKVPARVYASEKMLSDILHDQSLAQLTDGAMLPGVLSQVIAMPDCHQGYSVPIGFVGAFNMREGVISPGAVGFDINCGVRVLKSHLKKEEIENNLEKLVEEIYKTIPSGLGRGSKGKIQGKELENILEEGASYLVEQGYGREKDIENCESEGNLPDTEHATVSPHAKKRGEGQVGTLGSGNHFIEIQQVEKVFDKDTANAFGLFENQILVMIHCGSRGLGHQVCSDYLKEFKPLMSGKYEISVKNHEFACVPFHSPEGKKYFKAMNASANYAFANRQMITYFLRKAWNKLFGKGDNSLDLLYDVAHNIIKEENHLINGKEEKVAIYRKGATRSFPPSHPEIPPEYRKFGQPVLLPGTMGTASHIMAGTSEGKDSFYSTSHGAGRTMSRKAATKNISGKKLKSDLNEQGIIVKCKSEKGLAEEAPFAYKNVEDVVEVVSQTGLSMRVAKLRPLAVIKGE